jgi:AcrR family transcriptional regulator
MTEVKLTPRKEQALETRHRIFETAVTLFDRQGYDSVTIDDICREVGMSKGAFYTHFKSKDQVLLEEFVKIDEHYLELLTEIEPLRDGIERLERFWISSLEYIERMGVKVVKVVFHSEIGPSRKEPIISSRTRPVFRIVENLIAEGQGDYIRDDMSSSQLADSVIACWRGLVFEWCLANGAFDLAARGTLIFELLKSGFQNPRTQQGT